MRHRLGVAIPVLLILVALTGCQERPSPLAPSPMQPVVQGVIPPQQLGDRVWLDANNDGIQGDASAEPGVPNVLVELYTCAGAFVARDTTDALGLYLFKAISQGSYKVHFVLPSGYAFSPADQGANDALDGDAGPDGWTACTTLTFNEHDLTWDAGLHAVPPPPPGSIGDFVWDDVNMNGIQDSGEPGVYGVVVTLLACDGSTVATAATDANGAYLFADLVPGDYKIRFTLPAWWSFSPLDQGADDADSDAGADGTTACTTLEPGENDLTWDAGIYMPPGQGCTFTIGYWKNHPEAVAPLLPIWLGTPGGPKSVLVSTVAQAVTILRIPQGSNGICKLQAQLLAGRLAQTAGASNYTVVYAGSAADAFLATHDPSDWNSLSPAEKQQVLAWKTTFDDFNNGDNGPPHCD